MFTHWFLNVPANMNYAQIDAIHESFMQGGYYRYDYSSDLTIISLNSILVNIQNKDDLL